MPKGPNGEKRPADSIGLAVHIAKIATGEVEDQDGRSHEEEDSITVPEQRPLRRKPKKSA